MKREAILHIGPMKTGSTSIQGWLRQNRDALSLFGLHVPRKPGVSNLSKLSRVATTLARGNPIEDAEVERQWRALVEELTALPKRARAVIISGEMMGQKLRGNAVEALKSALDPYFDSYRIIVYLRRQDEIAVSRFTSLVRKRATTDAALLSEPMDYAELLADFGAVFGREALVPRLFARHALHGNDIIADFAHCLGLSDGSVNLKAKVKNQALQPAAQGFLMQLYAHMEADGGDRYSFDPDNYKLMVQTIGKAFLGPGRQPSRDAAMAFVRELEAANEAVRAGWFPAADRLFSDDFSRYPEAPTRTPSADEVLAVAYAVIARLASGTNPKPWPSTSDFDESEDVDEVGETPRSRPAREDEVASSEQSWNRKAQPRKGRRMKEPGAKGKGRRKGEGGEKGEKGERGPKIDNKIISKTGRTLWRIANQDKLESVPSADRRTQWTEQKEPYLGQARKLLRALRKDGIEFTMAKEAADDESDLEQPLPADDKVPVAG